MPTTYTSLIGLALPATGELSGTWGTTVNDFITQYIDAAVAGAQTISGSQTAVTLSVTNGTSLSQAGSGSTGSAQYHIINCTGNPASALTVTVPSSSRAYLVLNNTSTSQTVTVKGAATTGVTVSAARAALIAWNGTDFELVGTDDASRLNGVLAAANGGTGQSSYTVGDILFASGSTTLSKLADVATGNALISGGVGVAPSYGKIGLTTHVSGTLPIANGGTNATATPTAGTIAYGTGTAYAFNTAGTSGQPLLSGGSGAPTFGTLSVGAGGTGATTLTANNVILGNGTSAVQFVAPGTAGNVLTSNGTTWTSAAAAATLSGVTQSASPFETALGHQAGNVTTGANNTWIGYQAGLLNTTGADNVAVGYLALDANTTGSTNTAIGSGSMGANTIGTENVAVGYRALSSNTTGNGNTGVGTYALNTNTTGIRNTANGYSSLYSNSTGGFNTASGYQALFTNSTGSNNTASGYNALYANTTGANNTAVGYGTLDANTTGQNNIAMGTDALGANTIGGNNTAIGYISLFTNSTGDQNTALGSGALYSNTVSNNTAVGYLALYANTTGNNNTAVGWRALDANTTGINSTAVGSNALGSNTIGESNVAIGYYALATNTTGNNNTAVGTFALNSNSTGIQNTAIGQEALALNGTGNFNIAVGTNANGLNTTGANNVSVGYGALYRSTVSNNTSIGYLAGDQITTGSQNTIIGSDAASSGTNDLTTGSNNTIIGYNAAASSASVSNEVTIGNSSVSSFRIPGLSVTWSANTVPYRNLPPVGTKTGSYTLAVADVGKYVQVGSGGSITIPDATFAEGDAISIFNNTTGNITITCSITTAYIAGTDTDKATMTLATRGVATILFISSTICVVSGNVT